jgi:hypothetical protein
MLALLMPLSIWSWLAEVALGVKVVKPLVAEALAGF